MFKIQCHRTYTNHPTFEFILTKNTFRNGSVSFQYHVVADVFIAEC